MTDPRLSTAIIAQIDSRLPCRLPAHTDAISAIKPKEPYTFAESVLLIVIAAVGLLAGGFAVWCVYTLTPGLL